MVIISFSNQLKWNSGEAIQWGKLIEMIFYTIFLDIRIFPFMEGTNQWGKLFECDIIITKIKIKVRLRNNLF